MGEGEGSGVLDMGRGGVNNQGRLSVNGGLKHDLGLGQQGPSMPGETCNLKGRSLCPLVASSPWACEEQCLLGKAHEACSAFW